MPAVISAGEGGELNPGFDGSQAPVATSIGVVRQPTINFTGATDILSVQTTYGWDQVVGEARVVCVTPSGSIDEAVTLTFGASNFVQRFRGTIAQIDTTLAPHSVTLLCKGPLYKLETFKNDIETTDTGQPRPGVSFADLLGSESGTLKQIVSAVLTYVGVSFSGGNLADPSHIYGTDATDETTWGTHETAAAYVHRFFEASAGYRLFDSADGNVYLRQISSLEGIGAEFTMRLGVDIFGNSSHTTSSIGRQGAVIVHGYDDGSGAGPATSGVVGSGSSAFQINSPLIETDAFAAEIANYWLPQVDRLQEIVRLSTPRDELFGPAQIHHIEAADGLSVNDSMWVKSVTTEIASSGEFTQHVTYVGGVA